MGSTTVANDGGPVAALGALQVEGEEEGTAVSVVPQQTVLPEWTSLSLILSTRASTHRASLILCGYVCSIFYVVC